MTAARVTTRRTLHPALGFALKFFLVFALALVVIVRFFAHFEWLSQLWAQLLAWVLGWSGLGPAEVSGTIVTYAGGSSLVVILECTGLHLFAMWLGVVIAFPATWAHRGRGLLVGAAVVAASNLVRLWVAAWVLVRWPARFDLVHTVIWQTGMIVIVLLLAGWWMRPVAAEGPHGRRE